jgi:hypothetical protein
MSVTTVLETLKMLILCTFGMLPVVGHAMYDDLCLSRELNAVQ